MKKMLSLILLVSCSVGMLSAMDPNALPPHDGQKPPFDLAEAQRLAGQAYDVVFAKGKALYAAAEERSIPLGWIAAGVVLGYWSRGRLSPMRSRIVANTKRIEALESTFVTEIGEVKRVQSLTHKGVDNVHRLLMPQTASPVKP